MLAQGPTTYRTFGRAHWLAWLLTLSCNSRRQHAACTNHAVVSTCPSTCQHLAAPGRSCGSIRPYALSSNPHATTLASCRNPRGPVDRSALAQPSTTLVQPSHKLDYCTPEFLAKPARPHARTLNPDDDRRVRCRAAGHSSPRGCKRACLVVFRRGRRGRTCTGVLGHVLASCTEYGTQGSTACTARSSARHEGVCSSRHAMDGYEGTPRTHTRTPIASGPAIAEHGFALPTHYCAGPQSSLRRGKASACRMAAFWTEHSLAASSASAAYSHTPA